VNRVQFRASRLIVDMFVFSSSAMVLITFPRI
jgi:hypothetical protein